MNAEEEKTKRASPWATSHAPKSALGSSSSAAPPRTPRGEASSSRAKRAAERSWVKENSPGLEHRRRVAPAAASLTPWCSTERPPYAAHGREQAETRGGRTRWTRLIGCTSAAPRRAPPFGRFPRLISTTNLVSGEPGCADDTRERVCAIADRAVQPVRPCSTFTCMSCRSGTLGQCKIACELQ